MPEEENVTRKLRAILSADVKGYSILMADDEEFTVKTLKSYRKVMSAQIVRNKGRVVDSPGDNLLAEFASVVDAVQCAVELQKKLKEKNEDLPEDKRLEFRIGVNIGDVIQDGDRIYGNGVNVAARIEGLADAGGICISRNAYGQIRDKLELGYEYLGDHSVKNIKQPVRVYKVLMDPEDAGKMIGNIPKPVAKKWIWATAMLALIVITVVLWQVYQKMTEPEFEPAKVEEMAYPLPEKPSIAVLAFDNMTGDKTQEYFSDGLSEEIITALASVPELFVIARNSSFTYKGKPVKVQKISEELGVRYVLEGSVRKSGDNIRITVQLIDALKGHHLWAENFDRNIEDLFALQEEIAVNVITELRVKLRDDEKGVRIGEPCSSNLKAYLKYLKAVEHFRQLTPEGIAVARRLIEEAIELDPGYSCAYAVLGGTYRMDVYLGNTDSPMKSFAAAKKWYEKAIDVNPSNPGGQAGLADILSEIGLYEQAINQAEKALTIDSNFMMSNRAMGFALYRSGKSKEAVPFFEKALRLDPYSTITLRQLGQAYFLSGQNEKAIETCNRLVNRTPQYLPGHLILASAYSAAGNVEKAKAVASAILKLDPKFTLENYSIKLRFKIPADKELIISNLRKAGLPDYPPGKEPPGKPSIAVLPFDNLSSSREQEYLSDGITDDIITDLSKIKGIIVISRNSMFTYKRRTRKVPEIAQDLNVRYILEGTIQREGNKIRINVKLIDAKTEHNIWAEQFNGNYNNVFDFQDDITTKIVSALSVKLTPDEDNRLTKKGTENLKAYDEYLKGIKYYYRTTPKDFIVAIKHYRKAIELDPRFSRAYAALGITYQVGSISAFATDMNLNPTTMRLKARQCLELAMQDPTSEAYRLSGYLEILKRRFNRAIGSFERAISIAPNNIDAHIGLGWSLIADNRPKEALAYLHEAIKLDPLQNLGGNLVYIGVAHFSMGDFKNAIKYIEKGQQQNPALHQFSCFTAASFANIDNDKKAKGAFEKYLTPYPYGIYPTVPQLYYRWPFKNIEVFRDLCRGLIKVGLPGKLTDHYFLYPSKKLKKEEIKRVLFGKTIYGSVDDLKWQRSVDKNGIAQFETFYGDIFNGNCWIEDDMLCFRWENLYENLKECGDIYHMPEENISQEFTHFYAGDIGLVPFSIK